MIEKLNFRIRGVAPLVMHNGQLADPANKWTCAIKEVSSKRKKVEADFEEMARLEWMGGLYLHKGEPCIPGYVLEGALIGRGSAARMQKMGKEAAAGLYVVANFPLLYNGSRDPVELWKDEDYQLRTLVRVQQSRIMRTRPIFNEWEADVMIEIDPDLINPIDVGHWMEVAGAQVGLMDWRPKCGRFEVVK